MFTKILWTTWKISIDPKWSSDPWLENIAVEYYLHFFADFLEALCALFVLDRFANLMIK